MDATQDTTEKAMNAKTIPCTTDDGDTIYITVPTDLPSNERADYLRTLYNDHVDHPDGHWKGRAAAVVTEDLADDVAEAMNFMGSTVDRMAPVINLPGMVAICSKGYWAHGY